MALELFLDVCTVIMLVHPEFETHNLFYLYHPFTFVLLVGSVRFCDIQPQISDTPAPWKWNEEGMLSSYAGKQSDFFSRTFDGVGLSTDDI